MLGSGWRARCLPQSVRRAHGKLNFDGCNTQQMRSPTDVKITEWQQTLRCIPVRKVTKSMAYIITVNEKICQISKTSFLSPENVPSTPNGSVFILTSEGREMSQSTTSSTFLSGKPF